MQQAKFSLDAQLVAFLNCYQLYGYKDKSAMVRAALESLQRQLELASLRQSADLYAEVYAEESELPELTEAAVAGWPE